METNKPPSPIPTIAKYLFMGLAAGIVVGSTLSFILYKVYNVPPTLINAFIIVGIVAGCYYGSVIGYSKYRKDNNLGL